MPINRKSLNMMGSSGTEMNKYSTEVKGDNYYGYSDGLHTIPSSVRSICWKIKNTSNSLIRTLAHRLV